MSLVERTTTFWQCNICGVTGDEFTGTVESELPPDWWTGDLTRCITEPRELGRTVHMAVAICPVCAKPGALFDRLLTGGVESFQAQAVR